MSIWPRFLLILALTLAKTAIAGETGLPCEKPQDAFTKAVCADESIRANLPLIASKSAPGNSLLPWLRKISVGCNITQNTVCVKERLLVEWLKYAASKHITDRLVSQETTHNTCSAFGKLLIQQLNNLQPRDKYPSPQFPQPVSGLSLLNTVSILAVYKEAGVELPSQEARPYGLQIQDWDTSGTGVNVDVLPFENAQQPRIGFLMNDGGNLACQTLATGTVSKNTQSAQFSDGFTTGCLNESVNFFSYKGNTVAAQHTTDIDGSRYELFGLDAKQPKPLCNVTGTMKLSYKFIAEACNKTNPGCLVVRKEVLRLAKYFDDHRHIDLQSSDAENIGQFDLLPGSIKEDITPGAFDGYDTSGVNRNYDYPKKLTDIGFEPGKYSTNEPWQLFKAGNKTYLLTITNGKYHFNGYIFWLATLTDEMDDTTELGWFAVSREQVKPAKITITYPSPPASSGNATAQ